MKKTHFVSLFFFMVSILSATCAFAEGASFDCVKTVTSIEKMICSDQELSDLDKKLSNIYGGLIRSAVYPDLKEFQRAWLKERNKCSDAVCLKHRYEERIATLTSPLGEDNTKATSNDKKSGAIPQYRVEPDPRDPGPRPEICGAFLKILNTTPFEKIYQDTFLEMLKGRGDFDTMDWQYIEDGEKRFGDIPLKRIQMEIKPEWVEEQLRGFKEHKEAAAGFDYYLTKTDIWKDGKLSPILFYVNRGLEKLDDRRLFNYVVLTEGMKGPDPRGYSPSSLNLTSSFVGQLFQYKKHAYVLKAYNPDRPYISEIYSFPALCGFSLKNKE